MGLDRNSCVVEPGDQRGSEMGSPIAYPRVWEGWWKRAVIPALLPPFSTAGPGTPREHSKETDVGHAL